MWRRLSYFFPDSYLFFSLFTILILGLLIIASLSSQDDPPFFALKKQLIILSVAFVIFILFSIIDWRILSSRLILLLYFICLILLALVLIIGNKTRGATAWFRLGIFSFQPLELTKIVLILLLARYLASRHLEIWQFFHLFATAFFTSLPVLLLLLQPDLGGALILISIWFAMILISGIRARQILLLFLLSLVIVGLAWSFFLKPYQKNRILSFLNPEADPLGAGYNKEQALIAVGSGGIIGKGLGWGTQTHLRFLPLAKTDFIFAALAEELGLIGVVILLGAYLFLIWRIFVWSTILPNNFSRLFAFGLGTKLLIETTINIGMNLGMLPIIGIALPFMSLGGSHLLADFLGLGILVSMIRKRL